MLLSLLAAGVEEHLRSRNERLAQAERDATSLAFVIDENISHVFERLDDTLALIGGKVDGADWSRIEHSHALWELMIRRAFDSPLLRSLELYDRNGRLLLSGRQFPTPAEGAVHFGPPRAGARRSGTFGSMTVSGIAKSEKDGLWYLTLVRPVENGRGETVGYVVGSIGLQTIRNFFRWSPIGAQGKIKLLYRDGTTLVDIGADPELVGRRSVAAPLAIRYADGGETDLCMATYWETESTDLSRSIASKGCRSSLSLS